MWNVEYTDEFGAWWDGLSESVQEAIAHDVEILRAVGPGLGRPQVDTVKGSRCWSGLIDGEWFNQVESAGTS